MQAAALVEQHDSFAAALDGGELGGTFLLGHLMLGVKFLHAPGLQQIADDEDDAGKDGDDKGADGEPQATGDVARLLAHFILHQQDAHHVLDRRLQCRQGLDEGLERLRITDPAQIQFLL